MGHHKSRRRKTRNFRKENTEENLRTMHNVDLEIFKQKNNDELQSLYNKPNTC